MDDSSICGTCVAPPEQPPAIHLRYPPETSQPLVGESESPGSVCRMTPVEDPCSMKQVSPTVLSGNILEPDAPPRVTQTSIGKFLVPNETPEGENGNSGAGGKESKVSDRVLDMWTDRDKAWWVDKPGKNAPFLHCVQKEFTQPQPYDPYYSHKSKFTLIPRPQEYELSSIIARRLDCLDDDTGAAAKLMCNCGPSNTCCPDKYCQKQLARCKTPYWWHDVPFWWYGDADRAHLPTGSPDDYSYIRLRDEELKGHEPFNLVKTLQLDRAERYIPGQIYCDERRKIQGIGLYHYDKCHPAPPPLTAEQMSDKAMAEERATCRDRPYSNPKRHHEIHEASPSVENTEGHNPNDHPCRVCTEVIKRKMQLCEEQNAQVDKQRQEDLLRVGQPFRSNACKLHHQLYPPQKQQRPIRTSMKLFPHTRVTNL